MKPVVRFDRISKKYTLGASHSSLRDVVAKSLRKMRRRAASEEKILWALRDVSFDVPQGAALGLIGPNGSGKTTTLKLLSKITYPTSGHMEVNGRVSALIELGAGFHPDLTGRENVYLNGTILGMPRHKIDRSFDKIVAFSGLERFIDTPVKRYSSGMYVRLGFSVAAHVEPDVLLVDEVLAVGDAQFRQKCAKRIEELRTSGTTIVFVAHNLYLVRSVCDTAIFMLDGRVQHYGDVDMVIRGYEKWLHERQAQDAGGPALAQSGRFGSSDIKITNVEVQNLNGNTGTAFEHSDPVAVQVHFETTRSIQRPNLVLRIRRADGTTACMVRTTDYGFNLDAIEGNSTATITIDPLQLAGGAYMINAFLLGSIDGVALAGADSKWFQVAGISLSHEESSGIFVPHVAAVEVEQRESQAELATDLVP